MQVETNAICCEAMCAALSRDDLVLRREGPALPSAEAPALGFCPFCGAQYLPPEGRSGWGWRVIRIVGDEPPAPAMAVAQIEYNTPY